MHPEDKARQLIDSLLAQAGWVVQDRENLNLDASLGVAVRYFPLETGEADYLLFANKKTVGVVEAKPSGTTLSGVAEQSEKYITGVPSNLPKVQLPLPFAYESTGDETYFRDVRDPEPRARPVFAFHKPETLLEWAEEKDTLRKKLTKLPVLEMDNLRECQFKAISNLELSFAQNRPRALIQMASGSGKTYTAVSFIYRLIKFAGARRVLFLVDRNNLGRQTLMEFQKYVTPDDGRKFTELYNVQRLAANRIDPVSKVCITTIQRLYSMLKGEPDLADPELEERSLYEIAFGVEPVEVAYNPNIPIETFDFIITDECHRSIYNLWRQVLEYFDAFIIGLTATPSLQTVGFFDRNLVMEYNDKMAVADRVSVDFEVYYIRTDVGEQGGKVEADYNIGIRDKLTRKVRWEMLNDDLVYEAKEIDRSVVVPDHIRTIIRTFRDKLFTELFPERAGLPDEKREVPKTLIFAKDDSHAEDIVHIVREEFGRGNQFCKKITYKTTGEKTEELIRDFANSYYPRIAVTVDMIATGTDIKPLECIIFMRDVKSRLLFEQMKGRGTRTIDPNEFKAVTPSVGNKTHFIIVDAVGVCENDLTESKPLERKRNIPFEKILEGVALGIRDEDTLSSLASRLARLDKEMEPEDQATLEKVTGSRNLSKLVNSLLQAIDPDKQEVKAKEIFKTDSVTEEQIAKAYEKLAEESCAPLNNPNLRNTLIDIKKRNEQKIDEVTQAQITKAQFDSSATERAKKTIESFEKFIQENKDKITALQIILNRPYRVRDTIYEELKELHDTLKGSENHFDVDGLWRAYQNDKKTKVRAKSTEKILTDLISLVRFAVGQNEVLEPFPMAVDQRFQRWLEQKEKAGFKFTLEQKGWLEEIKNHISASAVFRMEDFDLAPFDSKGSRFKAKELFGKELNQVLNEMNEVLVA